MYEIPINSLSLISYYTNGTIILAQSANVTRVKCKYDRISVLITEQYVINIIIYSII